MALPKRISEIVERFTKNYGSYKNTNYNETRARIEFIDPFFKELGWDIDNTQGFAEAYKDVIHEDAIKVEGSNKAPDYSFRIGGQRKFFLEAKKPSVNLRDDTAPAYQLRRYAWNAGLPVSILTDFEEFAVYDTTVKPNEKDKASTARIFYCTFKEYDEHWDYINSIFSKDAIFKGSFDEFAKGASKKKGTTQVDKEFLKEMESWRHELAKNIALRNSLSIQSLNYIVQATIDRILFLRICEDRNIEDYGQLQEISKEVGIYEHLKQLFQKADDKYNSGLFHFKKEKGRDIPPDDLSLGINIDDKILKQIITALYYPSPYEFSVISADILGNVYEQFLGKVIRLTPSGQAKVEEKPEIKKAGGVYYTPQYIVKYIVEITVGELLKGKTPMMVAGKVKGHSPLRVLDPACGSGSFLINAYQYLLDWHRDWYEKQITGGRETQNFASQRNSASPRRQNKWENAVYQGPGGHWYLTTREKKAILTNNIFGVDIDHQAVEVTKLNLLLKVLEGENRETIGSNLKLFQERALPDLANNIKCGNSLIGSEQNILFEMSDDEKAKLNAFDWDKEFPDIFQVGGFDAVIGNPPYVRQEILGEKFKKYAKNKFQTFAGTADLYTYFIEKSLSLLADNGLYSIIVANKWMRANYGAPLREFLKSKCIHEIIDFGDLPVFTNATTYPCIIKANNEKPKDFKAVQIKSLDFSSLSNVVKKDGYTVSIDSLRADGWSLANKQESALLDKIRKAGVPLGEYVNGKIFYGIKTGLNEAFVIDTETKERLILEDPKSAEVIKPFLEGKDIKRYAALPNRRWLIFFPNGYTTNVGMKHEKAGWAYITEKYPAVANWLSQHEKKARARYDQGQYWWELRACDYYEEFEKEKIIVPAIVQSASYMIDKKANYSNDKTSIIGVADYYLLGLLNSRISDCYIFSISSTKQGGYYEYKPMYVSQIPIHRIDETNPIEVATQDKIIALVNQMLSLKAKEAGGTSTPPEAAQIKRQIDATDREIDRLVYELYELTEAEIKIVEGEE